MICDFPSKEGVCRHGDMKWSSRESFSWAAVLDHTLKGLMNPNIVSFPARSPSPNRSQVKGCTSASQEISRAFFWIELHIWYTDLPASNTPDSDGIVCRQTTVLHHTRSKTAEKLLSQQIFHKKFYTHSQTFTVIQLEIFQTKAHCVLTQKEVMNSYSSSKNAVFTPIFLMSSDYDSWARLHVCQCQRSFWIILPTIAICVSADSCGQCADINCRCALGVPSELGPSWTLYLNCIWGQL